MAPEHRRTMTVEEYFLLEKNDPETCYEYIDGYIDAMSGGSFNHDTITSNVQRMLWGLLRGGKCRVYSSDIKVYIANERYLHPDVTVICCNLRAWSSKSFPQVRNSKIGPGNSRTIPPIPPLRNTSLSVRGL